MSRISCNAVTTRKLSLYRKKGLADQSKVIPFEEYIFIARCELGRENKNEKSKPDGKNK